MTPAEINTLLGSVGAIFVAILGGFKWLLAHIAASQKQLATDIAAERVALALKESEARVELSARLHDEIRLLREEINTMHASARVMMRRIYDLEKRIHDTPGIDLPLTLGWPPL